MEEDEKEEELFAEGDVRVSREGLDFYRVRLGRVEVTYDRGADAWYIYLPASRETDEPRKTWPIATWARGGALINLDLAHVRGDLRVTGIEIISPMQGDDCGEMITPEELAKQEGTSLDEARRVAGVALDDFLDEEGRSGNGSD